MVPLGCLAVLSTLSLLIPVSSGENLGYSITLLLALYVYKETVEASIEPWASFTRTPELVGFISGITALMTVVITINVAIVHWTNKMDYELTRHSVRYSTFFFIMCIRWTTKDRCTRLLVYRKHIVLMTRG